MSVPWYDRFNNYKLGTLGTFLVSSGIAITSVLFHDTPFDFTEALNSHSAWLADLGEAIYGYFFVSRMVSGVGYVTTPIDIISDDTTLIAAFISSKARRKFSTFSENIKKRPAEFSGLCMGLSLAIGISIAAYLTHNVPPVFLLKHVLIMLLFVVTNISTFSGLFSRLGRAADFYKKKWREKTSPAHKWINEEHVNYVIGVTIGIIVGIILVGVVGGLCLLPGGQFVVALALMNVMSTCVSSSGYIGRLFDVGGMLHQFSLLKIIDYFRASDKKHENIDHTKTLAKGKKYECRGTLAGSGLGIALGVILIIAGIATLPFFGLGLPKVLAGIFIILMCISVSGGLGNRVGNAFDKKRPYSSPALFKAQKTNDHATQKKAKRRYSI